MGVVAWLSGAVLLVGALLALALFDQSRARKASEALRLTAQDMGALPIATMRNGAQIVFLRREASVSDAPFLMLKEGESQPVTAAEIRRLWNGGRLWWYHTGETPPLGLSYYQRYLDGEYVSSCSCRHVPSGNAPDEGGQASVPADEVSPRALD